jgi:hypothetical protein
MRLLVESGADKETKTAAVRDPSLNAAPTSAVGAQLALTCVFAAATTRAQLGATPLYNAAYWGHEGCLRAMLECGADKEAISDVRAMIALPALPRHLLRRGARVCLRASTRTTYKLLPYQSRAAAECVLLCATPAMLRFTTERHHAGVWCSG